MLARRGGALKVTFYGVRGSCPCSSGANSRYGGNTSCVALEVPGEAPVVLDLGTGVRAFGEDRPAGAAFRATALLSHLHWDHVQGLPFLSALHAPGAVLDVYGPAQPEGTLADAFDGFMCPPYFPVRPGELGGEVRFHDLADGDDLVVGTAKVRARTVPHCGPTLGYRVEWGGAVVAYVSDHQGPVDGGDAVAEAVLELADGADLLIHDAQYTAAEFAEKARWGHSTVDYAVAVARRAGAHRLALFHHDPAHDDDELDRLLGSARRAARGTGVDEVLAAAEGTSIALGR